MKLSKWEKNGMVRVYINSEAFSGDKVWFESVEGDPYPKAKPLASYLSSFTREFVENLGWDFFVKELGISNDEAKNLTFEKLLTLV